ncbi:DUF1501 domain-containing protein [Roseimaritima ulvae]|uniref:DUF1501 domain-containing protein n=1 Tax=Roseimaritima ulvae TaxID=980254 RepID=A0A5B9R300_9BACT|nr:DUF1501 domain-containing protein [Roseimaritima ulvae]QEG40661.1 hypothetical protein UC8_26780 [Roseimaritima ulvae]
MARQLAFSRRQWLGGTLGLSASLASSRLSPAIARAAQAAASQGRHCILLWMAGGPSQLDTFDMKPKHVNGGSLEEAATSVPGVRFAKHLPRLAKQAERLAILRGMSTKEGDHGRGTTLMQTGHIPGGPVNYPASGCTISRALADDYPSPTRLEGLPHFVSVAPGPFAQGAVRSGFLGPKYAPMSVGGTMPNGPDESFARLRVDYLQQAAGVSAPRQQSRLKMWNALQDDFLATRRVPNAVAHNTVFQAAIDLAGSKARDAFDLEQESQQTREAFGSGVFGQGCLLARRLLERGVPLVEVTLGSGLGWDTHADNFNQVERLCGELDQGWATLMDQLQAVGLLESTTILWAGEFGRTPVINGNAGRDHYPQAFSCVLAGGGVAGGQVYGATSDDGSEVVDGKSNAQDLLTTLCTAIGVSPATENITEEGRPIAIAEGNVIKEVLSADRKT